MERPARTGLLATLLLLSLLPAPALASDRLDLTALFRPATTSRGLYSLDAALTIPPWQAEARVAFSWTEDPLQVELEGEDRGIHSLTTADLVVALGLPWDLEVALDLPVVLDRQGTWRNGRSFKEEGLGDLGLSLKWAFLELPPRWRLAGRLVLDVPTGDRSELASWQQPTLEAELLAELTMGPVRLIGLIGATARGPTSRLGDVRTGSSLRFGVGGVATVFEPEDWFTGKPRLGLEAILEVAGETLWRNPFETESTPLELSGGGRLRYRALTFQVDLATSLIDGLGASDFRGRLTVSWEF